MSFRAWLILVPALGGCFLLPSGEASRIEDVPEELRRPRMVPPAVPDRHPFGDVSRLKPGQWASYRENGRFITIAAVARAREGMWIEVIEEGEVRQVSAREVGPDGTVTRAYYRELSEGERSTVEPQQLEQAGDPPPPAPGGEAVEDLVTVGGRELAVTVVRVRVEDIEGRLLEEETAWSPKVPPLYAGSPAGGLVRKRARGLKVDLVDFGTDAISLVEIPGE